MKCSKCGTEFDDTFCPNCGEPSDIPADNNVITAAEKKHGRSNLVTTFLVVIGLGLIIAFGVFINNLYNNGLLASISSEEPVSSAIPIDIIDKVPSPSSESRSSAAPETSSAPDKLDNYHDGMYKIGSDLPAGEYEIISVDTGYFEIAKDSLNNPTSIITNENFKGQRFVTVKAGQYLTIKNAFMYSSSKSKPVNPDVDTLADGMYRVGIDIKAGEYKIHPTNAAGGYYEVASDSTHSTKSIVTNENFTIDKYLTVKAGQYLTLDRAEIILK